MAVSHELELPIYKIGVGEGIEDLRDFDAHDFASALIGDFDERYDDEDTNEKEFDDEAAEHEVAIEEDEIVSEDLPEETSVEEVCEDESQEEPQEESQEESQDEPQEEQPKKKKHFWERWF